MSHDRFNHLPGGKASPLKYLRRKREEKEQQREDQAVTKPRPISHPWYYGATIVPDRKFGFLVHGRMDGITSKEARRLAKWLNQFADWSERKAGKKK